MYNELEYNLVELDLPNIVYAHRKGVTAQMVSHPFLRPLLTKLAKARPKWRLVGVRYAIRDDGPHWATTFKVMEGNVELGEVSKDYNHSAGCDSFSIDNPRMAAVRQRGYKTMTKDVAKAFKIITSKFHGKTPEETIRDARERAYNIVSANARGLSNRHSGIVGNLRNGLLAFAEANWDAFKEFAAQDGSIGMANIDQYHEAKEDAATADMLQLAWSHEQGDLVVLRGSDYIVKNKDGYKVISSEDLTPHLKRSIGILKLAEAGTYVFPFGVKTAPDEMFLLPEQKEKP
jgi:hypothetical protein